MFKKFKTMSKEKEINIEDGNVQETVQNENNEQTTQNENTEENQNTDNKAEEGDNNTDAADKKAEEIDPLTKAQQEVEELKKQLLYKTAEFENYRKRTLKEKAELILNGGEKTVAAILPILDDFERAIADKSEDPKANLRRWRCFCGNRLAAASCAVSGILRSGCVRRTGCLCLADGSGQLLLWLASACGISKRQHCTGTAGASQCK